MSRYSIAEQIQKTSVMRGLKVWTKVKHVIAVVCAGTFSCVFFVPFFFSFSFQRNKLVYGPNDGEACVRGVRG